MESTQCRLFRRFLLVVSLCLPVLGGGIVCGQWEQIHKLTGDSGVAGFGSSVGVSGKTIAIGAYEEDSTGTAYLFDAVTGERLHKLIADDAWAIDFFGYSVSVSGNTIVVGAWGDDDAGSKSGSAYVFDASTGEQVHKLTADDAAEWDSFGRSVSVSGSTIVVGADRTDDVGLSSGSAYVFDADTGEQVHKITAEDAEAYDDFGRSVSVSGDTIVVGAYHSDDAGTNSGSAYVFDATTGEQLHKLVAEDAAALDDFGTMVSVNGSTIVVGAPGNDDSGSGSGSAYVFDATSGAQIHKLTADDGAASDHFGGSLSIAGNAIVVGAACHDEVTGAAYLFDATTGVQLSKITADDASIGDVFSGSVSISGNTVVVGAPGEEGNGSSAYVFQKLDAPCQADITGPDGEPDGTVDVHDLLMLLAQWGTSGQDADITGPDGVPDGTVDVHDLLALLGEWGPCR